MTHGLSGRSRLSRSDKMLHLQCSEIWGGIKNQDVDVCSPGLNVSLYSSSCDGGKGGDVYYFSLCSSTFLAARFASRLAAREAVTGAAIRRQAPRRDPTLALTGKPVGPMLQVPNGLGVVPGRRLCFGVTGAFRFSGEDFQTPAFFPVVRAAAKLLVNNLIGSVRLIRLEDVPTDGVRH